MRLVRTIWLTRAIAIFTILGAGVANASTTISAGYDLLTTLPGTGFCGVPYAGCPLGRVIFGGDIG